MCSLLAAAAIICAGFKIRSRVRAKFKSDIAFFSGSFAAASKLPNCYTSRAGARRLAARWVCVFPGGTMSGFYG